MIHKTGTLPSPKIPLNFALNFIFDKQLKKLKSVKKKVGKSLTVQLTGKTIVQEVLMSAIPRKIKSISDIVLYRRREVYTSYSSVNSTRTHPPWQPWGICSPSLQFQGWDIWIPPGQPLEFDTRGYKTLKLCTAFVRNKDGGFCRKRRD